MNLHSPIFAFDRGDMNVVQSADDLVKFIEPWDVSDTLEVFDSGGARVVLRADGVRRTRFTVGGGVTVIDSIKRTPADAARFEELLRDFVTEVGTERFGMSPGWAADVPIGMLVERVAAFFDR